MKSKSTICYRWLTMAEALVFVILAVVSSRHFGLADGLRITAAYLVAYAVPRTMLARSKDASWQACMVLFVLAVALIAVEYARLEKWTLFDEFSLQMPNLGGDSRNYYKWALNKYNGSVEPVQVVFPGFPLIIVGLWKVLGLNVVWPQAMNLMFTLMTVVFTAATTRRLLAHRVSQSPQVLMTTALVLSCLLSYFLLLSSNMLKEGSICCAVAMAGFSLSAMAADDTQRQRRVRDMLLFVLACVLIAMVRTTFLYFIALGVVVMGLPKWRRDWPTAVAMLAVVALALAFGNHLSSVTLNHHVEIASGGWNMQRFFVTSESQQFYHDLLNYYFLYSTWHKLLMLPLTMAVQFIIPLPWVYYDNPSLLNQLARMTYGWYLVGGTALFYYLFVAPRRGQGMGAWPWWPAAAFAVIAYVMAGSVARYVVPIEPLFVPVAAYVLCRLAEGRWRKAYIVWLILLVILVASALLVCIEIQQGAISKMLHTQSLVQYLQGL